MNEIFDVAGASGGECEQVGASGLPVGGREFDVFAVASSVPPVPTTAARSFPCIKHTNE